MAVSSNHIPWGFYAHFIYSLKLLLITTTILSELPLTHRCASHTQKNEKDAQFFAKVSPWDKGKLGLSGPTPQKFAGHHGMFFEAPFCHSSGHVYTKEFIRYCSALNIEET